MAVTDLRLSVETLRDATPPGEILAEVAAAGYARLAVFGLKADGVLCAHGDPGEMALIAAAMKYDFSRYTTARVALAERLHEWVREEVPHFDLVAARAANGETGFNTGNVSRLVDGAWYRLNYRVSLRRDAPDDDESEP